MVAKVIITALVGRALEIMHSVPESQVLFFYALWAPSQLEIKRKNGHYNKCTWLSLIPMRPSGTLSIQTRDSDANRSLNRLLAVVLWPLMYTVSGTALLRAL